MSVISLPVTKDFAKKDLKPPVQSLRTQKQDVTIEIDANILVTGRPNSGVEDFKTLLTEHLDALGLEYQSIQVKDATSANKAASAINNSLVYTIIEDDYRLLFSTGRKISEAKHFIYITRHWNLGMVEYSLFDQHLAFSSHRNEDITGYPHPFSGVGGDLSHGEYILMGTKEMSAISKTRLK